MNVRDALAVWRRRWILTLLLLLMALAGTAAVAMKLPRHYQAQSTVALLPSSSETVPNGRNPYLTYNGSLPMTAQIISYQLMAPESVQSLAAHGNTASFTVTLAPNSAGAPILNVVVTGSNKSTVERTLIAVTSAIGAKLSALQAGISSSNQIAVMTLSVDTHPSTSLSKTARPTVVILFLGVTLALAIPVIIDGTVRRRVPDEAVSSVIRTVYPRADDAMPSRALMGRYQMKSAPPTGHSVHLPGESYALPDGGE